MANYTKATDFASKDSLPSGDPGKIIKGTEFGVEFDAISTAITSKANAASPAITGTISINGVDVTSTAAELNILDGVTSTAAELNILDGVASTAAELNLLDGSVAGTVVNSKGVVYGAAGEVNATTFQIAGTSITSTAAELNILDGVTSFLDEDTMSSDSATSIASQQSIKAYVDSQVSGGGGLSVDATVRTGAFTAVAGNIYQCNMTSAFTATLPISPSAGDEVGFAFVASSDPATNNLTLGRNSEEIENEAADFVWDISSPRYFSVMYFSAAEGWKIKL